MELTKLFKVVLRVLRAREKVRSLRSWGIPSGDFEVGDERLLAGTGLYNKYFLIGMRPEFYCLRPWAPIAGTLFASHRKIR